MSHAWVAECEDCDWLGDDHQSRELAAEDARLHSEGKRHLWQPEHVEVWTPEKPRAN